MHPFSELGMDIPQGSVPVEATDPWAFYSIPNPATCILIKTITWVFFLLVLKDSWPQVSVLQGVKNHTLFIHVTSQIPGILSAVGFFLPLLWIQQKEFLHSLNSVFSGIPTRTFFHPHIYFHSVKEGWVYFHRQEVTENKISHELPKVAVPGSSCSIPWCSDSQIREMCAGSWATQQHMLIVTGASCSLHEFAQISGYLLM